MAGWLAGPSSWTVVYAHADGRRRPGPMLDLVVRVPEGELTRRFGVDIIAGFDQVRGEYLAGRCEQIKTADTVRVTILATGQP
jgi:hypothetical protein